MKTIIVTLAIGLLTQQIIPAQGTLYVSNLGQTSTGSYAVGSDSWYAAVFVTGTNVGGYLLDSVQLAMTDAAGNPSSFAVMIYSEKLPAIAILPGSSLGILDGSANPSTTGIYTYTDDANITLVSDAYYYMRLFT